MPETVFGAPKTGNFTLETGNSMHKPNIATPEADNGTSINGQGLPKNNNGSHKKGKGTPIIACPKLAIEWDVKLSMAHPKLIMAHLKLSIACPKLSKA